MSRMSCIGQWLVEKLWQTVNLPSHHKRLWDKSLHVQNVRRIEEWISCVKCVVQKTEYPRQFKWGLPDAYSPVHKIKDMTAGHSVCGLTASKDVSASVWEGHITCSFCILLKFEEDATTETN